MMVWRKIYQVMFLASAILGFSAGFGGVFAQPDAPGENISLTYFARMSVLAEGRIKPMDTYARDIVLQFSGRRSFDRKSAVNWLARLLFVPERTRADKIFLIDNPEIPMAMGAAPEKKRRYNFDALEAGYPKLFELAQAAAGIDEKQRTVVEREILRVYENLHLYTDLTKVFAFSRAHSDFTVTQPDVIDELDLPSGRRQFSFLEIALKAGAIERLTRGLEQKNPAEWTGPQRDVIGLLSNLYRWSTQYKKLPLHIIPSFSDNDANWESPWDAIATGFQTEAGRGELALLDAMQTAYRGGRPIEFDLAVRNFNASVGKRVVVSQKRAVGSIPLETVYNKANFFLWAEIFYLAVFFIFLSSLISARPIFYRLAWGAVVLGFIPHVTALVFRIAILARPPVSNLYETFIFVGFVSVAVGLIVEKINKQWLGLVIASVCGFVFLLIAGKYSAEGDTLRMLIAVLNSNFWLSTHVLSITTGYAGCCVAGVVGHVYLIQAFTRPRDKQRLAATYKNLMGILGFGLIMTFLGTTLGGIWADQSWGRFWGWDPKENGALLIVLWTAIIFHARIAKLVGPLGVAVGSALGIIVVMWAWFGVNLLSIGLHSYGFTSGVAAALGIYVIVELIFLGVMTPLAKRKIKTMSLI